MGSARELYVGGNKLLHVGLSESSSAMDDLFLGHTSET